MKKLLLAACGLSLLALWSCDAPTVQTGRMVDPIVIEVSNKGQEAKVNIGELDGVHAGQRLYVARANKLVGLLAVRKMDAYISECIVVASKDISTGQGAAGLDSIRVGDVVHRDFMGMTRPGNPKEKVERMVPVPYQPAKTPGQPDNLTVIENLVPRDKIDDWVKKHPNPNLAH